MAGWRDAAFVWSEHGLPYEVFRNTIISRIFCHHTDCTICVICIPTHSRKASELRSAGECRTSWLPFRGPLPSCAFVRTDQSSHLHISASRIIHRKKVQSPFTLHRLRKTSTWPDSLFTSSHAPLVKRASPLFICRFTTHFSCFSAYPSIHSHSPQSS